MRKRLIRLWNQKIKSHSKNCKKMSFFILKPDGRWTCARDFDGHQTCTDAGDGKHIAKLAGFVASILTYTKSSSTTLVDPPSKNEVVGTGGTAVLGAAVRQANALSSSLSLRLDPNTLVTVLPVHKHALVLQTNPKITGKSMPLRRLRECQSLLILLFGPPEYWAMGGPPPRLVTEGIEDMIDGLISTLNPSLLLGGVRRVDLPATTMDQIDQALKSMPVQQEETRQGQVKTLKEVDTEQKQTTTNKKTAAVGSSNSSSSASRRLDKPHCLALLSHGCRSVLHSRINSVHLKKLMTLLQLRDIGPFETTTTPVYHTPIGRGGQSAKSKSKNRRNNGKANQDQWYQLVVKTVQRGVLICEFPINTTPKIYNAYMANVQRHLYISCNSILPSGEPPVPLHLFVDHQTVALCAYDRNKNTSLCPQLRPTGPTGETERLWKLFWWFLRGAMDTWDAQPTLAKITMVEGDISFHAVRHESLGGESADVFVMTTASQSDEAVGRMTKSIVMDRM